MYECFATSEVECLILPIDSLPDLLGNDLLDRGVDQLIGPFLKLLKLLKSFLSSFRESLGFFGGSISIRSMLLLVRLSDPDTAIDDPYTSSGFSTDFNLRAFMAFCEGFFGHLMIPSGFRMNGFVAMPQSV